MRFTLRILSVGLPICGIAWQAPTLAAVVIPDNQDQLDKAIAGADFIGGSPQDSFSAYVGDQEQYDSNVYRLANGTDIAATVGPHAVKQDYINSPSAGLEGQWSFGRQTIDIDLNAQDNLYADNSVLNNVSTKDTLDWNWGVGSVISGQAGIEYLQGLASFVNANSYLRNVYEQANYFAAARYQVGPRWAVYGGILNSGFGFNQSASRGNNSSSNSADVGAELITDVENTFDLDYRYTDARYPNPIVLTGPSFDPDFREDRIRFLVKRMLTEKTSIDFDVGYLKREYPNDEIGSFSGPIWRGSFGWQPTEKTQLIVATWRNLQAYLTDQTDYYRSTGVSISPVWRPTEKITVSLAISRETQDYIGASTNPLNESARNDTVNAQAAGLSYTPTDALVFDVTFHHEQRASNQPIRSYDDQLASAHVRYNF